MRTSLPFDSISVLMPVFQGAGLIERVLDALGAQSIEVPWDFLAVDSGSTDGTLELLERRAASFPVPFAVQRIPNDEFDHGDTRNLLAALSSGELLVFVTDDAIPESEDWLWTLVSNLVDPGVGAAYCRNVPRQGAHPLARRVSQCDLTYAPGRREQRLPVGLSGDDLSPDQRRILFNYCDTGSVLRRELWERHPYPRTRGGEDVLMARALIEAGYTVIFEDRATVQHTHEYTPARAERRAFGDGEFNREALGRVCIIPEDAQRQAEIELELDRAFLAGEGYDEASAREELARAEARHRRFFAALAEGARTSQRAPRTRLRKGSLVSVAFVGGDPGMFPLEELRLRGHACRHLAGATAAGLRTALGRTPPDVVCFGPGGPTPADLEGPVPATVFFVPSARMPLDRAGILGAFHADLVLTDEPVAARELRRTLGRSSSEVALVTRADPARPTAGVLEWEYRLRSLASCDSGPWHQGLAADLRPARGAGGLVLGPGEGRASLALAVPRFPVIDIELTLRAATLPFPVVRVALDGREQEIASDLPQPRTGGGVEFVDGRRVLTCRLERERASLEASALPAVEVAIEAPGSAVVIESVRWLDPRRPAARPRAGAVVLEARGIDYSARLGEGFPQHPGAWLLGPGAAALEFDVSDVAAGPHSLELRVPVLAVEVELWMAGRILLDGRVIAHLGTIPPPGQDGSLCFECGVAVDGRARVLRLENGSRAGARSLPLRVGSVRLRRLDAAPRAGLKQRLGALFGRHPVLSSRFVP